MISKSLYFKMLVRILMLLLSSLAAGLLYSLEKEFWALACFFLSLLLGANLLYFVNTINRRLYYFFEAVSNEDTSITFPKSSDHLIQDLNDSLAKVNLKIQKVRMEAMEQEHYFQALLEHAATGMMTFNDKGFILHSNKQLKELIGVQVLTHINQLQRIAPGLYQATQSVALQETCLVNLTAAQSNKSNKQLLLRSNSFVKHGEKLTLLSVQDIQNQLDEKELDAWQKLIRVMMHEVMNSITPIHSLSDSLSQFYLKEGRKIRIDELSEQVLDSTIQGLAVISEQGKGLISFVESYRQLTQLPQPDMRPLVLKDLLNSVGILAASLDEAVQAKLHIESAKDIQILGDSNLLSKVLINIIKNAFEARGTKAQVQVGVQVEKQPDGMVEIHITDDGIGIAQELLDKIFVPFFTTKSQGSGIGLNLCRQIIHMHGGSIKVNSKPQEGTELILRVKGV